MIHPASSWMFTAVLALAGYYLLQLGVISGAVIVSRISQGNLWAFLLIPVTAGSLHFALWALRSVAAEIPRG